MPRQARRRRYSQPPAPYAERLMTRSHPRPSPGRIRRNYISFQHESPCRRFRNKNRSDSCTRGQRQPVPYRPILVCCNSPINRPICGVGERGTPRNLPNRAWRQAYRALEHNRVKSRCSNLGMMKLSPSEIQSFGEHFIKIQRQLHP